MSLFHQIIASNLAIESYQGLSAIGSAVLCKFHPFDLGPFLFTFFVWCIDERVAKCGLHGVWINGRKGGVLTM